MLVNWNKNENLQQNEIRTETAMTVHKTNLN